MKIYHFCQFKLAHSNGIQAAVWELARGQARLGAEVEIVSLGRAPLASEVEAAGKLGIRLSGDFKSLPRGRMCRDLARFIAGEGDVVVHFHSVFIPRHTWMAACLRRCGVPYFVSPHGNLGPRELARKRLKKQCYLEVFERTLLREAAGLLCVSKAETAVVERLLENPGSARHLGNGVDPAPYQAIRRTAVDRAKVLGLSLGKSDALHKGYDRMFGLSGAFSGGVDYRVVTHNQRDTALGFKTLCEKWSGNPAVRVAGPVHGPDKVECFANADVYFHLARWEVFGMVLVEGALAGLPLVLSQECDLAEEIEAAGAGLVVDADAADAGGRIREWLATGPLESAGARAREWAMENYSVAKVAARSIELYRSTGGKGGLP